MRYRTLGRTGIQVSPYALGTMNFGALANADHDETVRIIHKALDAGINLIDTADNYSHGESERIVGKALKGRRDDVVLATKFSNPMGDGPNRRGASRRYLMTAVEDSLRRLETDHIDLYQYHYPDDETDLEETLSALTDLVRAGKVRAIGTSKQPPRGSSRRTGSPSGRGWRASAANSRTTRYSTGASSVSCSPSPSGSAWARSCGARWRRGC